jgi:hypothetical protein
MCGNDCKALNKKPGEGSYGLFSGLLLLVIPKCPFCFIAFSGVLVACGTGGTSHQVTTTYSVITIIISVLFCLTSLLSIVLHYRPGRGNYALVLAVPGVIALIYSVVFAGGELLYYSGALFVLAGLVRNSGMWTVLENKFFMRNKPSL